MRNVLLAVGLGSVVATMAWACGSDVNATNGGTGGGGGGKGGSGGATTSTSTTSTTTTTTTTTTTKTTFDNSCEEACDKIANECGFGQVCSQIPFLNCSDPSSYCYGDCILAADCVAIASLAGSMPDPALSGCVNGCMGGGGGGGGGGNCVNCVVTSCGTELQACQGDNTCKAFLQCAQGCSGDSKCFLDCQSKNPGKATDDLAKCATAKCANDCFGGGGGGGQGGAGGGSGGAGGGSGGGGGK